jgi:2-amino-4-hydroxy-6-hydroxymethyldihydropteridine diphosphokinase
MSQAHAYIGLGANLGDMQVTLRQAIAAIDAASGIQTTRLSPLYRSAPVDAPGPGYVNAVAQVHTSLAPLELLVLLRHIETQFGRQRHFRNAPRTLDLDLLLYDELMFSTPTLTVPHPRMHLRAFVLKPLIDLTHAHHLVHGQPLTHWLAACAPQHCEPLT